MPTPQRSTTRLRCAPVLLVAALAVFLATAPRAASAGGEPGAGGARAAAVELDSGRQLLLFPGDNLFRPYRADPHTPASAILVEGLPTVDVEASGDFRYHLKFGGRFGVLRFDPAPDGARCWQLNLDVGLDAQFDIDNGLDNLGWDGNYGLSVSTRRRDGRLAFNVGALHTSAHLGDEWIERTGSERINYTREELRAGVRWWPVERWSLYAEGGWAYLTRGDLMEPGRFQVGAEWEAPASAWGGLAGWYAGIDLSTWEERDWRLDWAVQAGVALPTAGQTWRLGVEYTDGRVPLGEFFQGTESALVVGIWAEL